ncbi:hypothetical protein ACFXJ8_25900 [Nonomuraea sp. NPDC059194]|uniref:hypothetical protein n=1 Tax=Nonomuraea sp. NPDC059194 TaxID=3346764 RepID=UPI0036B61BC5
MCQEVRVTAGAMLLSGIGPRVGGIAVVVAGSAGVVLALAQGSQVLAWLLLGVTAWAAIATVALVAVVASPRRTVVMPAPAHPATHPSMRVLAARPQPVIEQADAQPLSKREAEIVARYAG